MQAQLELLKRCASVEELAELPQTSLKWENVWIAWFAKILA